MEQGEEKISRDPPKERYHRGMHWGVGGWGGYCRNLNGGKGKGRRCERERGAEKKNEMKEGKQGFIQK